MSLAGDVARAVLALLVGLAVVGGYGWWLYRRLGVAPDCSRRTRRVVLVVLVVGATAFVAAAGLLRRGDPAPVRPVVWLGMTEVALALYLTLSLAAVAAVALGLRLTGRPDARRRWLRAATPAAVGLTLAVTAYGAVAAQRPGVEAHVVTDADLPAAFDGLRIVLLTDLHVGPLRDASWARRVVDLVNAQDPDLVVLGGDLVDGAPEHVAAYVAPLADLAAPLGVVAVTGNHEMLGGEAEAAAWVEVYESLGIDVLANESVVLRRGGAELTVAGVHDQTGVGALAADPDAALDGVDPAAFVVFVAHEPKQVEPDRGVDLQLSGHTHGGQLWPVHLVVPLADPVVAGYGVVDGVPMVVSRGVGTSGPPVRVLAPSQVDVVVLRTR